MKLKFYGAAQGVTGSCHILHINGKTILIDCGLIQGGKKAEQHNRDPFPFDADKVSAVILTHAHIDHSGRLPLLVKRGFKRPIYTQHATKDLCRILLADSASLAARDAEYANKKRKNKKDPLLEPLYDIEDVDQTVSQIQGIRYNHKREILPGVTVRYRDAGHILGSASVEVWLRENGAERKLVFSGDLGQYNMPILHDPASIKRADLVVIESTYGDRLHRERARTIEEIGEIISAANHSHGNILIPAFAVGRSQEILYQLGMNSKAWGMRNWQIFLDSPLAIEASKIYWDYPNLYDVEATRFRKKINEMPELNNLYLSKTVEESRIINKIDNGAIIIAGSGMCNGGRILHHFKYNLNRKNCHVMIVGWQAYGTLGRRLVEGEETVRIHGKNYMVRAQIHTVGGLSAHGDQKNMLRWLKNFKTKPLVYVVHGESETREKFSEAISAKLKLKAKVASVGEIVDLIKLESQQPQTPA